MCQKVENGKPTPTTYPSFQHLFSPSQQTNLTIQSAATTPPSSSPFPPQYFLLCLFSVSSTCVQFLHKKPSILLTVIVMAVIFKPITSNYRDNYFRVFFQTIFPVKPWSISHDIVTKSVEILQPRLPQYYICIILCT